MHIVESCYCNMNVYIYICMTNDYESKMPLNVNCYFLHIQNNIKVASIQFHCSSLLFNVLFHNSVIQGNFTLELVSKTWREREREKKTVGNISSLIFTISTA